MLRTILAVLGGAVVWDLLYLTSNNVLFGLAPNLFREDGSTDSVPMLLLILFLSVGYYILSGYITATIARRGELGHALALGLFQLPQGIYAQILFWELLPLWYHLSFLVLLLPCTVLGGKIRQMRREAVTGIEAEGRAFG